jgi:hypothetical protein
MLQVVSILLSGSFSVSAVFDCLFDSIMEFSSHACACGHYHFCQPHLTIDVVVDVLNCCR